MTETDSVLILDEAQIDQKIKRIAYEVYENNFDEKILYIAGIMPQGYVLAKMIKEQLDEISEFKVELLSIDIDKNAPSKGQIKLDFDLESINNKVVLMVDDVQHTGKTFAYAMRPFLNVRIKKIEVAVLVNRAHTSFPIAPTYTGYELATTLTDHITVVLDKGKKRVFLQ